VDGGVPGAELLSFNENYHIWHHSKGDTISVLNADDLDLATSLWASVIYTVANLDDILPRGAMTSSSPDSSLRMTSLSCLMSTFVSIAVLYVKRLA